MAGARGSRDSVCKFRPPAACRRKGETATMRALDKFILRMRNRRGKGTGKQRKKDNRRQPSAVRERPSDIDSNGRQ